MVSDHPSVWIINDERGMTSVTSRVNYICISAKGIDRSTGKILNKSVQVQPPVFLGRISIYPTLLLGTIITQSEVIKTGGGMVFFGGKTIEVRFCPRADRGNRIAEWIVKIFRDRKLQGIDEHGHIPVAI